MSLNNKLYWFLLLFGCVSSTPTDEAMYHYEGEVAVMEMRGDADLVVNKQSVSIAFNNGQSFMYWKYKIVHTKGGFNNRIIMRLKDERGRTAWLQISQMHVKLSNQDGIFSFPIKNNNILRGA